jgi:hypothetical protein
MQTSQLHRTEAHEDDELIEGLEPDQIVAASSRPLPRMHLTPGWRFAFWALRLFVLGIAALVIDVFIASLG